MPVMLQPEGQKYVPIRQVYWGEQLGDAVRTGHIEAVADVRAIPVGLRLADGSPQDSYAEAIVKLVSAAASTTVPAQGYYVPRRQRRFVGTTGPLWSARGIVVSVDLRNESFVLRHQFGTLGVFIDNQTLFAAGNYRVSFAHLRPGATVAITIFEDSGAYVAAQVQIQ